MIRAFAFVRMVVAWNFRTWAKSYLDTGDYLLGKYQPDSYWHARGNVCIALGNLCASIADSIHEENHQGGGQAG